MILRATAGRGVNASLSGPQQRILELKKEHNFSYVPLRLDCQVSCQV